MKLSAGVWLVVAATSLLTLPATARAQGEAYRVVVNTANPVTALPIKEISDLFLGKTARWPDGSAVKPVDQSSVSTVRGVFTREVHGKKVDAVINYWQQIIFSGRGLPPAVKASDQEVVAYVKANAGAIGYVSPEMPTAGLKVIAVKP
jgi:ABC-type phosphate transport system substrate-binding protein